MSSQQSAHGWSSRPEQIEAVDVATTLEQMLSSPGRDPRQGLFGQYGGRQFYCQNPAQSGDTTGLGLALALVEDMNLLFLVDAGEALVAIAFLDFYRRLGLPRSRIVVMLCDDSDDVDERGVRERLKLEHKLETELDRHQRKGTGGFATAKQLLELRFGEVSRQRGRSKDKIVAFRNGAAKLDEYAGAVLMWNHHAKRSANQIYQDVINIKLRTRKKPGLKARYEKSFQLDELSVHEIGKSTRDLSGLIAERGVSSVVRAVHGCLPKSVQSIDRFRDGFLDHLFKHTSTVRSWAKKPILALIWVRGLSGRELASVKQAKIGPSQVDDEHFRTIDAAKRNPHHVMTAQLYEHLLLLLLRLGNRKGAERRFIPVPIGDPILLDQYNPASEVHVGEEQHNLIRFFARVEAFKGNRYNQMYFIKSLFGRKEFGLAQIGIRSGALEQGMYLGVPTIYIEEFGSDTGERMARLTSEPDPKGVFDLRKHETMPFFHRLQTRHLIGLNQARTKQNLQSFVRAIKDPERAHASARVLEGSLRANEAEVLSTMLAAISKNYEAYLDQLKL